MTLPGKAGMLSGLRVVEVADELGEYCGLLLAGLGAEVIKVEPPGGNPTRRIGPFYQDEPHPDRSLFFWNYNRGKRSIVLNLAQADDRKALRDLVGRVDILLDASSGLVNEALGLDRAELLSRFPALVVARITPFGDVGPWKDFKGSDLVHLALGGVMMNCGYDPDAMGRYDLPPIAPQLWHAYHITGEQLAIGIIAALLHRERSGEGQDVSCAVHEAVAKSTELDLMSWVMRRVPLHRQTCRHSTETIGRVPTIGHTKDGRWAMTESVSARDVVQLAQFLLRYGMAADLADRQTEEDVKARAVPGALPQTEPRAHMLEVAQRFVRAWRYEDLPWREAQEAGLVWAPLRKPHENAEDPHWLMRKTFSDVEHPELGRSFRYATSKWLSDETSWQVGSRAPLLGEHGERIRDEIQRMRRPEVSARPAAETAVRRSARGKPFALQGIRVLDFGWFLASAGGTRFVAALGGECIKVEWKGNPDTRVSAMAPVGGREARNKATGPLPPLTDPDIGGQFNNKNAGKRGLSLNVRDPRGLEIAKRLVMICDVVSEGFSPGVLDRLGLGYPVLKQLRPDVIYAQQPGMGNVGEYGRFRTIGPIAAAFVGTSEMSGLPEPAMPAGWGYSYLDWAGAYSFGLAILGALYYRARTGKGQYIDASQCETGIFMTGVPVLDWSANARAWTRIGNRSPYKPAAPHGAYRCAGEDRWIAIACFDDAQWTSLLSCAGLHSLASDPRFATLAARLLHQDALDAALSGWTSRQDAYDCMLKLQQAGVPAGVCQSAEDRCDRDPQLASLEWLTEVTGTKIGRWPIAELPMKLTATPAHIGGAIDRGAPCYGEDNEYVLGELLGYSTRRIAELRDEGVI